MLRRRHGRLMLLQQRLVLLGIQDRGWAAIQVG
jgi:hypothetical protein